MFPISQPNTDFNKTNKLIYGFPGTGKTTLAAHFIDNEGRPPLFIMSEAGLSSLSVAHVRVSSWEGLKKLIGDLEANAEQVQQTYSCFVLDLVSDFDVMCSTTVADQKRVEYIGDMEHGKGWRMASTEFEKQTLRLNGIRPITFIAHTQEKDLLWNGEKNKMQAPNLSKGALNFINGKVDVIMWINPANSKKALPSITFRPSVMAVAKSRQKALCRQDFPYDPDNPKAAYEAICSTYAQAQAAQATPTDTPKE